MTITPGIMSAKYTPSCRERRSGILYLYRRLYLNYQYSRKEPANMIGRMIGTIGEKKYVTQIR